MPLSSLHYLLAWAAASMSKKGLSHTDGEVNSCPETVVRDSLAQMPITGMNDVSMNEGRNLLLREMNNVVHCFEIQDI